MAKKIQEKTLFDDEISALPEVAEVSGLANEKETGQPCRIVKVRPTLTGMEVGDEVSFPVLQMKSVRAQCSELGVILDRRYQTRVNRTTRVITVTRTA